MTPRQPRPVLIVRLQPLPGIDAVRRKKKPRNNTENYEVSAEAAAPGEPAHRRSKPAHNIENGQVSKPTSLTERIAARERRREQQRRHRQRLAAGRRVYPVELDGPIIDLLVRLHWLDDGKTGDDRAVACAVYALLSDTAKKA